MCRKLLIAKMIGVLAVLPALSMATGFADEETEDETGQWKYVLEDDGAIIWVCVNDLSGHVDIPDSVISIGDSSFGRCIGLTSVTLPDSVVSIGDGAFSGCKSTRYDYTHTRILSILPLSRVSYHPHQSKMCCVRLLKSIF